MTLSSQIKHTLAEKFKCRISFDKIECLLYSHDLASPPSLIKPIITKRIAEGVVQPQSEEELSGLLQLANKHKIPLTPRGRGTSGYGGAIPRFGGLVVDFSQMNKILEINPQNLTATTEPGVIWQALEQELAAKNLTLRLYPGSAPSSTVAGWLAQGGSGFGSYAYGWFGENVVSVRVVEPSGRVTTYTADELDMVRDAEGITGFISQITLKLKPAEYLEVLSASFETAAQLADTLNSIVKQRLKLWSASFINPHMTRLRGNTDTDDNTYLGTFVYPKAESGVSDSLKQLIQSHQGRILEQEAADKLWGKRFELMKIKKTAPSLISTKVVLPLESLSVALKECSKIKQPLAIEGVILQDKNKSAKAVLLGFIPHDERKISYNLAYGLALCFIRLTENAGGRPCATGIYFKRQAAKIIGQDRLVKLIREKRAIDKHNILNPGKVIAKDGLDLFMKAAWILEPLIRFLANRISLPDTGDINDISRQAYACDQCGFCLAGCPQFQGWESQCPRGWWYLLRLVIQGRLKMEEVMPKFKPCSECAECKITCPQELPPIIPERLGSLG